MNNAVEAVEGELAFLRFFYNRAKEHFSDGGTDETYWFKEEYEESGKTVPEGYAES